MLGKQRLRDGFGLFLDSTKKRPKYISGILGLPIGEANNTVQVSGRDGFVYVRLRDNLNEVIQAYNDKVSPVYDLPVLVERDEVDRSRYRIVERDLSRYEDWGASPYLPVHGNQHSFNPSNGGGGDVTWTYSRQFMPLLVTPSGSAGAANVIVQGSYYYYEGSLVWAGDTGTASALTCKPTGGNNARMASVYLDEHKNPQILCGDEFDESVTGSAQIISHLPDIPSSTFLLLAGIRLVTGTSKIVWDNIYDLRPHMAGTVTGSAGGGSGHTIRFNDVDLPDRTGLNFVGTNIWAIDNAGSDQSDIIVSGTAPGGVNTQVQYNNSGSFGGSETYWAETGYGYSGLGVNNPNPERDLHIGDGSRSHSIALEGLTNGLGAIWFSDVPGDVLDNAGAIYYLHAGDKLYFRAGYVDENFAITATTVTFNDPGADIDIRMEGDNDENLFYLDGGNDAITIGGTTEIAKFGVEGNADEVQLGVRFNATQTNNGIVWQDSSGNVLGGIDERGVLFCDMNTSSDNLFLGSNAGNAAASGANDNIGIGENALSSVTSGDKNMAIGTRALDALTTAEKNMGIGRDALGAITTGNANVAIGDLAGRNLTSGNTNVAMGSEALEAATTAAENFALGQQCMEFSTGSNNVGIGKRSFRYGSGGYNIAIGRSCMPGNASSSGSNNICFGEETLGAAYTSASNNVAIGHRAARAFTTGSDNLLLGYQAADALTTGSDNVCIGPDVAGALTTGDANVLIGHEVGTDLTTESNRLYIDNSNTSTPLIYGEFDNDLLIFNGKVTVDGLADEIQLKVQAHSSQSANLLTIEKSDGTVWAGFDERGILFSDGGTAVSNVFIGSNAGNVAASGALNNVAIGSGALDAITSGDQVIAIGSAAAGALTTAQKAIAIGYRALYTATTACGGCVAIGDQALYSATSGTNVAIGSEAAKNLTTATNCVAIGANALKSHQTGNSNVALGNNAAQSSNGGSGNFALGFQSLYENVTGTSNVAIGAEALKNCDGDSDYNIGIGATALSGVSGTSSGAGNVAIGYHALRAYTSGSFNLAIGKDAGDDLTSGNFNVLLGLQSGDKITTGSDNVCIGPGVAGALTTGDANVLIGHDVGTDLTTESNKLYIDNSNTSTPLIYGEFDNDILVVHGDLGINSKDEPTANGGQVIYFADNTADPTMATNTAGLYAKDVGGTVEMFAIDEAGNATQISPHDPDTGEWVFYSKNIKTGRVVRVDMERMVKVIEKVTGEQFMVEEYL